MAFPPKDKDASASAGDMSESESGSESESTSDVPESKKKGNKPNPLRRWAEESGDDY